MRSPRLPLALLASLWAVALAAWTLASLDVRNGALAGVSQNLRVYCFGGGDEDSLPAVGRPLMMLLSPFVMTLVVLVVWRGELLGSRAGAVGLSAMGAAVLATVTGLIAVRAATPRPPMAGELAERIPAPAIALRDHDGAPFSLRDARGKVAALTFFYTCCTHTCPAQIRKMRAIQQACRERLGADVVLLAVSLDPVRDDRFALREYAVQMGCDLRGWKFLHGSREEVDRLVREYGVVAAVPEIIGPTTQIGHTALVTLIDRSGRRAFDFVGTTYPDDVLVDGVRRLLRESPCYESAGF